MRARILLQAGHMGGCCSHGRVLVARACRADPAVLSGRSRGCPCRRV